MGTRVHGRERRWREQPAHATAPFDRAMNQARSASVVTARYLLTVKSFVWTSWPFTNTCRVYLPAGQPLGLDM